MNRLQMRGVRVAFAEQGDGEPVVLLHSSAGSHAQWRRLIERLSPRYRVIAPDFYGYGETPPWPGASAFSLEHEAQIVLALLGRVGEPAHLVAHSYGGAVALRIARERPDLLASLCVIEPVAFHLLKNGIALDADALAEIEAIAQAVSSALSQGDYLRGFGCFLDYWNGEGAWNGVPAAKRGSMALRLPKIALDFHAALNDRARPRDFADLALPTLIVHGGETRLPTRRVCERLADAMPEARTVVVNGAGHMLPLTHCSEVNALIAAHLEAHPLAFLAAQSFSTTQ